MTYQKIQTDTAHLEQLSEQANLAPQVYTPKEVQILLRLSKNTVNALLNSGQLRAIRYGRKWLIPKDAITEFLKEGTAL